MATCNAVCIGAAPLVTPSSPSVQNLRSQRTGCLPVSSLPGLSIRKANHKDERRGQGVVRTLATSSPPASNGKENSKKGELAAKGQETVPQRQQNGRGASTIRALSPFDWVDSFLQSRSVLLRSLLDEMDEILEGPYYTATRSRRSPEDVKPARSVRTPWEVIEEQAAFFLRMDLPGFSREQVKVCVEEGNLVIKAEKKSETKDDKFASRTSSDISSKLLLPDNVELDNISAELKNGVLVVTIPKRAKQTKDVINISVGIGEYE